MVALICFQKNEEGLSELGLWKNWVARHLLLEQPWPLEFTGEALLVWIIITWGLERKMSKRHVSR